MSNTEVKATQPKIISYGEMAQVFSAHEHQVPAPEKPLSGFIRFNNGEWFNSERTEEERTYLVNSDNKAFKPNMGGWSVYGVGMNAYGERGCVRLDELICPSKYDHEWGTTIDCCWLEEEGE